MDDDELIGIEEVFRQSWDDAQNSFIEKRYMGAPWLEPFLALISEMRSLGYDEWFYANESRRFLVLSRSCDGSFSLDKNWLCIGVYYPGDLSALASIAGKKFHLDNQPLILTKILKLLLDLLMVQPIE